MRYALLRTAILLIGQGLGCSRAPLQEPVAQDRSQALPDPIPRTYFGVHIHDAIALQPWPAIDFGSWRLWDSHTTWSVLEPEPDQWEFRRLDSLVGIAGRRSIHVMLTLGQTPTWASTNPSGKSPYGAGAASMPRDLETWRRYVGTIARRYRGRIEAYEIWNEPDLEASFEGSPADLVALARVAFEEIRASDPGALIVSPPPSGQRGLEWLRRYFAAGGNRYLDVLGFHSYVSPDPPEAMLVVIARLRAIADSAGLGHAPIWDTEFGYSIATHDSIERPAWARRGIYERVLAPDVAAAFVARSYALARSAGISRLYWYDLDGRYMGLLEPSSAALKPAAYAYSVVTSWLGGSRLTSCSQPTEIWECSLILADGRRAEIVWNPADSGSWTVPNEFRGGFFVDLEGNRARIVDGAIHVGPKPSLITAE